MPEVLSTSPFTPWKLQEAVEQELEHAPENAVQAAVVYEHNGQLKGTVAIKVDRERWVLLAGGFVRKDRERTDIGGFGSVTVRF